MTIICTKDEWETLLPDGNDGRFTICLHTMLVKAPSEKIYLAATPTTRLKFVVAVNGNPGPQTLEVRRWKTQRENG